MADSLLARVAKRVGPEKLVFTLSPAQREAIRYLWAANARPEQLPPGPMADSKPWRFWLDRKGRGAGKTRSGAEWVRSLAGSMPGSIGAIASKTPDDVEKVLVAGPSGILACCPSWERPRWKPTKNGGTLYWPNGSVTHGYSGANPGSFRGPQWHYFWGDELPHWKYPTASYDNINFGLRLEYMGRAPQCLFTTTPLPTKLIRKLIAHPRCVVTTGSTYDNRANLAAEAVADLIAEYEGTRLGRQELHGELLDDTPGALWNLGMFRPMRQGAAHDVRVVAIDPATTAGEDSDDTGIVVAGRRERDEEVAIKEALPDGTAKEEKRSLSVFDVLEDATCHLSPDGWAKEAIRAYDAHEADAFVAEVNQGGDMVAATIRNAWQHLGRQGTPRIIMVTAKRAKRTRAEPIAALYEQGRVFHAPGLDELEDQLSTWVPGNDSPDRMDALVYAIADLSQRKRNFIT